jgi:hypothetical protein
MSEYLKESEHPTAYNESHFICGDCYCSVKESQRDAHSMWHEKLRRAVDETESLG